MDSIRNTTSRVEARERIRQELRERLRRRRLTSPSRPSQPSRPSAPAPVPVPAPVPAPLASLSRPIARSPPLVQKAIRAEEEERAREARWASFNTSTSKPTTSLPHTTTASRSSDDGWEQGDGRWAGQVVIYEGQLPPAVRARLEPTKETHFRFRHSSDEQAFLSALSSPPHQTATYQAKGKKDVTLTSGDGRLLGNIHFLHMDGPDVHRPEKYYMKFYLFNFADADILRDTKQRILQFAQGFTPAAPTAPLTATRIPLPRMTYRRKRQPLRNRGSRRRIPFRRRNLK